MISGPLGAVERTRVSPERTPRVGAGQLWERRAKVVCLHLTVCEWQRADEAAQVAHFGFQDALLEVGVTEIRKHRPDSAKGGQQTRGWKVKRAACLTHSPVCRFLQARHFWIQDKCNSIRGMGDHCEGSLIDGTPVRPQ